MKRSGILVFEDVEELDFVGPLEVFGMAARFGAECQTLVLAERWEPVRCRHGLRVTPEATMDDAPHLDILIVPGGLGARTHARENPSILRFIQAQTGYIASVCTGALILSSAGRLDGRTATTHHAAADLLRQNPRVDVHMGVRFIVHDRIATAAGVSAGIDLALALVAREFGMPVAERVATNMEWHSSEWRQPHQIGKPANGSYVAIRTATSQDVEAVATCLVAAFSPYREAYSRTAYEDTVLTPAGVRARMERMSVLVATSAEDRIVGTIAFSVAGSNEGHLRGMAVLPDWHGTGVAPSLLEAAERELREKGCHAITLDTTAPLRRAVRFYERHGYRPSGRVRDFFGMPLYEYVKTI